MRENDGRRLDHQTLEAMRLRAVDAVASGVQPEDVAASLGMARGTVYGWLAKHREGGKDALKARPVPGRPPKLTGQQMRTLYTLIVGADPRQYEFEFALWTRDMVRTLIHRQLHRGAIHRVRPQAHGRHRGPVYLIVDGHPTHRSKLVKEFVTSTDGRSGCWCCLPTRPSSTPTSGLEERQLRHEALACAEWG